MKKITSVLLSAALLAGSMPMGVIAEDAATATVSYTYGNKSYERQMEKLDRGLVAVKVSNGVYIGWRLSGEEGSVTAIRKSPAFEVYRNGTKIATVSDSTNYLDASGKTTDSYSVAIVGEEPCEAVSVNSNSYFDIPMDVPADFNDGTTTYSYAVGDASTGDLDGDGQYELVVKWDCNAKDNSQSGITGNVYLDAYELTGEKLWRIDLGRNIRAGAHYTQFLVYDFDLDGIAEVTAKTAPGSLDGEGKYVTEASLTQDIKNADNSAVYVNDGGYVLDGDEYFTAFDGRTGAAVDTIYYPNQRISASTWGDGYGNRCDRFIADVAYLDGEHPYAVYWRGYYGPQSGYRTRMGICGIRLDENKRLQCDYCFDTYDTESVEDYKGVHGYSEENYTYTGQGNHNMTVADVDNDGKDEFLSGSLCFEVNDEDKLAVKWCSFRGHGDALHIGDYDPTHYGLEYFSVHEGGGYTDGTTGKELDYGMTVYDAATGEELYHQGASGDTGRGVMANIGSGGYYQISGSANIKAMGNGVFENSSASPGSNFRIFWNGDLYDDILNGTTLDAWDGSGVGRIFTIYNYGIAQINGTKANPALQADLFGDWREELCYPLSDNTAVRVFTTTDVTNYKLPTLMHDPVYRSGVAAEQTAYNQPPHIGFYLSEETFLAAITGIEVTMPTKTVYAVGDKLDLSGMSVVASYDDGTTRDITNYSTEGFDSMRAGKQEITVSYNGFSEKFEVEVATGFTYNSEGYITGYNGTATNVMIPESIDGVEITGIADGAINSTSIKELYVYDNIKTVGNNSFDGMTIYCYEGSAIHLYALENEIAVEVIERDNHDYIINYTFEEDIFDGFAMFQSNSGQSSTKGNMNFVVGSRGNGGDGMSGFGTMTVDDKTYLACGIGQFASNNRHAYLTLSNVPALTNDADNVISFDFMIPETKSKNPDAVNPVVGYISIEDEEGVVDTFTMNALGVEFDTWYNYALIWHNGTYYRVLSDSEGEIISITDIGTTESTNGVTTMQFYQDPEYTTSNEFGKGSGTYIAMDNFRMYSAEAALANVYVTVEDTSGNPIADAMVEIGGLSGKTNSGGAASFLLPYGLHRAAIKAEGYEDSAVSIAAYRADVTKKVVMAAEGEPTATPTVEPTATPTPTPIPEETPSAPVKVVEAKADVESGVVPYGTKVTISSSAHVAVKDENGEWIYGYFPPTYTITEDTTITVKAWVDNIQEGVTYECPEVTYTYTVDPATIPTPVPSVEPTATPTPLPSAVVAYVDGETALAGTSMVPGAPDGTNALEVTDYIDICDIGEESTLDMKWEMDIRFTAEGAGFSTRNSNHYKTMIVLNDGYFSIQNSATSFIRYCEISTDDWLHVEITGPYGAPDEKINLTAYKYEADGSMTLLGMWEGINTRSLYTGGYKYITVNPGTVFDNAKVTIFGIEPTEEPVETEAPATEQPEETAAPTDEPESTDAPDTYGITDYIVTDEGIDISVNVEDVTDVMLYVAVYDEDGRLAKVICKQVEENASTIHVDTEIPADGIVKALLWKKMVSIDCEMLIAE